MSSCSNVINDNDGFDWDLLNSNEWNINQYGSNITPNNSPTNASVLLEENKVSPFDDNYRDPFYSTKKIQKASRLRPLSRKNERTKIACYIKSFDESPGNYQWEDDDFDDSSDEEKSSNDVQDKSRMMITEVEELIERLLELKKNLERKL